MGVVVVLLIIIFAVHARCSRGYDYKPGMPHDDTAETQLRGMGTPSVNSSSTHHSRPWGAAPIGRSTTTHSENSHQSTSKRGWPDGDRSQLYVMQNESANYGRDTSISSSHTHRSNREVLPCIPSPYHEAELEKWTKKHGHKLSQQYLAGEANRGSAGELSNSRHSGRTDRNTTTLAMKSPPEEFLMKGIHDSRTSITSSKKRQETTKTTPLVNAVANIESSDNTSPYVNKDGQLTPLGMAVSKLNDNGLAFRVPEGAENPDQEKKEHRHRKSHRHKDRHDSVQSPDAAPDEKGWKGTVNSEEAPKEVEKPKSPGRKLPVAPKMAFYSDDEPDFRPPPPKPPVEDIKAETLPREKSREKTREKSRDKPREKSSHRNGPNTHRTNRHHHRNGTLSPQRTSAGEEGVASGNSSTLRSDKSGSLDRHGHHHDRSHRKPPVHPKHGSRPRKHAEKPAVPPRPDSHRHKNHVDESPYNSFNLDAASYSLPSDHRPSMSDYSGGMSVEPSPVRLPRPLNRKQNREMLTQVFISDESLAKPQSGADRSGAESSRSGTSHGRQLPQTPTSTGFSPPRAHKAGAKRVQSDLSLSLSQEEPEFDYYIPTVPGSYFENPFPMGLGEGPSERRINKHKTKSPSASLVWWN